MEAEVVVEVEVEADLDRLEKAATDLPAIADAPVLLKKPGYIIGGNTKMFNG